MAEITVINEMQIDWLLFLQYQELKRMWRTDEADTDQICYFMQFHNPIHLGDWLSDSLPCWSRPETSSSVPCWKKEKT